MDNSAGASLRWCIDVSHDDSIILCLQTLPRALSAIDGRPAFLRDACPGHIVFKLPLLTDYILTGSLKGPRPILFSNAPDISRGALAESKRKISKAKKGEINSRSFFLLKILQLQFLS